MCSLSLQRIMVTRCYLHFLQKCSHLFHVLAVTTKRKLPSFQFKGQINYSDTVLDAENAANELLRQVEAMKAANCSLIPIGFDTEWKVVFKRGK